MGFSRQEYWNGLPLPSPGDFLSPGIEPTSPGLAVMFFTPEPPGSPFLHVATGVEISRAPAQEVFVALEKEIQTGVSPPCFSKSPLL